MSISICLALLWPSYTSLIKVLESEKSENGLKGCGQARQLYLAKILCQNMQRRSTFVVGGEIRSFIGGPRSNVPLAIRLRDSWESSWRSGNTRKHFLTVHDLQFCFYISQRGLYFALADMAAVNIPSSLFSWEAADDR